MSILEQARAAYERARREAQDLRAKYNAKVVEVNKLRSRVEHLAGLELDAKLELAEMRKRAEAEGRYSLAALLAPR